MERTITVVGRSELSVLPDYVTLKLHLKQREKNSKKAFDLLQKRTEELIQRGKSLGLEASEFKMVDFFTSPLVRTEFGKKGMAERVVDGYECRQSLQVGMQADPQRLGRLVEEFAPLLDEANFSVQFSFRDRAELEDQLLEKVREDALKKAQILCGSHAKPGKLLCVNYCPGTKIPPRFREINPIAPPIPPIPNAMGETALLTPSMAPPPSRPVKPIDPCCIIPEEQTFTGEATFIWEIVDQ